MSDQFKPIRVPGFPAQSSSYQALSDRSLGSALWEDDEATGYEADELFEGETLDECVCELMALLEALEGYRVDH